MSRSRTKISVVGFGAWGGALSIHLARHGVKNIAAWEYLPSIRNHITEKGFHPHLGPSAIVPQTIKLVDDLNHLDVKGKALILSVSSDFFRSTLKKLSLAKRGAPYAAVILTKGLDKETGNFFSALARKELKLSPGDIFVLSGPTIAKELLAGAPTRAVLAGQPGPKAKRLKELLSQGNFNVELSQDLYGVQLGGSMKNIYAIGFGVLDALKAPPNAKAIYIIKALEEMALFAQKTGGKKETLFGPAGLGDLLATSLSNNSRNSTLGRMLALGSDLAAIQKKIGMATEGVDACRVHLTLARKFKIKLPIAQKISAILNSPSKSPELLLSLNR